MVAKRLKKKNHIPKKRKKVVSSNYLKKSSLWPIVLIVLAFVSLFLILYTKNKSNQKVLGVFEKSGSDGTWCKDYDYDSRGAIYSVVVRSSCEDNNGIHYDYCQGGNTENPNVVRDYYCSWEWDGVTYRNVHCVDGGYDCISFKLGACVSGACEGLLPTAKPSGVGSTSPLITPKPSGIGSSSPVASITIKPTTTPTTKPIVTPTTKPAVTSTISVTIRPTVTPIRKEYIPPQVSITDPISGSFVNTNKREKISVSAADSSGIWKVEFYINDVKRGTDYRRPYFFRWLVPRIKSVNYTILVKAYDNLGNTSSSSVVVTSK